MTLSVPFAIGAAVALVLGITVVVVGSRAISRARVDRVRVPARSISSLWTIVGTQHVVEYPAPDGTPLRATIHVNSVRAPGVSPGFDGTVWVRRDDPSDVTPRAGGRSTLGVVTLVVGIVLVVGALGLGIASVVVGFATSIG